MQKLQFLTSAQIRQIQAKYTLPVFVYAEKEIQQSAKTLLDFANPFGLTVRYAMKANPNKTILRLFDTLGLHIDASSEYEAYRAIHAGIASYKILLTAQEMTAEALKLIKQGVQFNACSLSQLEKYGKAFPGTEVSIRINPGLGSGESNRVNVGGPSSSFGIRYEHIPQIHAIVKHYKLKIIRLHSHIGCGASAQVRKHIAQMNLDILPQFPHVRILNLGGGFKIDRMSPVKSANIPQIGKSISKKIKNFYQQTGRKLHLEIESGTYLMANSGSLITQIQDIVDTGKKGHKFLKINAGMTEVTRPSMYGAQHPLIVITKNKTSEKYIVVGHCCESGDMLTPQAGNTEVLEERVLNKAQIGDLLVIEGAGAYCSAMSVKNYNSFPEAGELLISKSGKIIEIRKRQKLQQMRQNEI